jgi:thioredoxin-like negative regulator of GroEL
MSAVHAIEQFEFHQTLESTAGTAIVFFSSRECLSCRYWQQLLEHYSKLHSDVHIFKIDAGQDQALTEEFNVFHLPALFLYHNGEYHSALQCEATLEALEQGIKTALAAPAEEMP